MLKISTKVAPWAFHLRLQRPNSYQTNFNSKFIISERGPLLCNNFLTRAEESLETMSLLKIKIKNKLLALENETKYFQ